MSNNLLKFRPHVTVSIYILQQISTVACGLYTQFVEKRHIAKAVLYVYYIICASLGMKNGHIILWVILTRFKFNWKHLNICNIFNCLDSMFSQKFQTNLNGWLTLILLLMLDTCHHYKADLFSNPISKYLLHRTIATACHDLVNNILYKISYFSWVFFHGTCSWFYK